MSTAPGQIMRKPSVKALRKRLSGRVAAHLDKTRAINAVGILFPGPDMHGVEHRPVRALDPMELKRTDPLRFLIQAYCFFSRGRAACEAAAAPAGTFVSGSARNLPIIWKLLPEDLVQKCFQRCIAEETLGVVQAQIIPAAPFA
jgi:hypothetical protein